MAISIKCELNINENNEKPLKTAKGNNQEMTKRNTQNLIQITIVRKLNQKS